MKFTLICTLLTILFVSQPVLAEAPRQSENQVLSVKIVNAIKQIETQGNCNLKGASGERGCFQFLPSTFKRYQQIYLSTTTLPLTPENEQKVMEKKVLDMLEKGHTVYDIGLEHNSGHFGKCSKGINRWGVKYDSCSYTQRVIDLVDNVVK